jgi:hypothetical protein
VNDHDNDNEKSNEDNNDKAGDMMKPGENINSDKDVRDHDNAHNMEETSNNNKDNNNNEADDMIKPCENINSEKDTSNHEDNGKKSESSSEEEQDDLNETDETRVETDRRSASLVLDELFSKDPLYKEKFEQYCRSNDLIQSKTQDDKPSVPKMRIAKRK